MKREAANTKQRKKRKVNWSRKCATQYELSEVEGKNEEKKEEREGGEDWLGLCQFGDGESSEK